MTKNKMTPIQILRAEKRAVKKQYQADEERLSQNWDYLSNNLGTVLFNSVILSAKSKFICNDSSQEEKEELGSFPFLKGISSSLPLIWEIAQPMLLHYAMKKVKNIFSFKNKTDKS